MTTHDALEQAYLNGHADGYDLGYKIGFDRASRLAYENDPNRLECRDCTQIVFRKESNTNQIIARCAKHRKRIHFRDDACEDFVRKEENDEDNN